MYVCQFTVTQQTIYIHKVFVPLFQGNVIYGNLTQCLFNSQLNI